MEFDGRTIGLTIVMYLVCLIGIWNPFSRSQWELKMLIILTIAMIPISYLAVNWQLNR